MIGAGFYGKINGILWVLQLLTIWISIGCMWFRQPMVCLPSCGDSSRPSNMEERTLV